jgi:hypothetical protein
MAIEKHINSRLALKIDTFEAWQNSTLPLLKGELAIATVAATAGTGLTEPVCMIKVGEDGVKTFKDIEWNFYAKASDVLACCKSEASLKAFVNNVIAEAGIASSEAMEALAGRVTTAENDIKTLKGDENTAGSVAKAIKDAIDALDLTNELAKKVDKEDGKSLVADTEIARLAGVTNYDDTQVKADIAKKADAESMTTELGKKVDKVEGYSLVSDTEIARLAAMKDGANKVEASETNGNIKIDGVETVIYTHPEKHAIADVTGLQDALDGKQAAGDYATKTEAKGYADAKDGAIQEAKQAGLDAASALETYKGEMVTALAGKQDVIPENTYDAYGAAAQALEDAKKYADENDADTQYGIEYDSATKKIKLVSDTSKTEIDATDFIKDGMIESVALSEDGLNLVITWNTDSDKGENNVTTIPLTGLVDIYTGVDGTTVTVSVSSDDKISAEVKTGSLKDGHIASDAAIAKGKLAADVQASLGKADTALQEHQDISHLATTEALNGAKDELSAAIATAKEEAIAEASSQDAVILSESQKYSDGINTALDARLQVLEGIDHDAYVAADTELKNELQGKIDAIDNHSHENKTLLDSITDEKVAAWDGALEAAKIDASNKDVVVLSEAQKYADGLASNYATAEQGAKADTALQTITTTENGGLKVTNNNQIDIDDAIVFILDCGDATA